LARKSTRRHVRLSREERLAHLMTAARAVFSQRGYQDTTTAEIAKQAGVVGGTIYHYFSSKRDLLIKVVEQWYSEEMSDYSRLNDEITDTRARLKYMISLYLRLIHDEPELFKFVMSILDDDDYQHTDIYLFNTKYSDTMIAILEEGKARGDIRPEVVVRVARNMIFGVIEYETRDYLRGRGDYSFEDLSTQIIDHAYLGLSARSSEEPLSAIVDRLEAVTRQIKSRV